MNLLIAEEDQMLLSHRNIFRLYDNEDFKPNITKLLPLVEKNHPQLKLDQK